MRFLDAAEQAFSFLEAAGFRLVEREPTRLQYETNQVFVTIDWDPRSGELNVFIGLQPRTGEPRDGFSLGDLLGMQGVEVPERRMPFQVADESRLGPFLEKLAEDIRGHGQQALGADRMFFHRLKAFRSAQSQAYMLEMNLRRVRAEAETAWGNRDLARIIDLYASIEEELTEAERARLAYARKHAAG